MKHINRKKIILFGTAFVLMVALVVHYFIVHHGAEQDDPYIARDGEVAAFDPDMHSPVFSHASGFYTTAFYLTMEGAGEGETIRFTLDGSTPTALSPEFVAPIHIHAPVPTFQNSPMAVGARPRGPMYLYYNGMVVRARIFDAEGNGSATTTHSYFVRRQTPEGMRGVFSMRVVSISVEPTDFVTRTGMYYSYNLDIRRMAYVEVFYPDGAHLLSQYAQLRVAGNWSRRERKKSLRLNFNLGCGIVEHIDLIPDTRQGFYAPLEPVTRFRHVTLRIADLHVTTIREALADRLSEPLRPENQNATPAVVFVNGEFWGMYCMREHRSRTFIAQRHPGISERSIVQLDFSWNERNSGDHRYCTIQQCLIARQNPLRLYPLNPCAYGIHDPYGPFGPWLNEQGHLPRSHPLFRVDFEEGRDEGAAYRSWMRMYNAITGGRVYCDDCMTATPMPVQCDQCRHGLEMVNQADFEAAMAFVCLDNLIDFFIVYYHFNNWDWPGNNFITWKSDTIYEGVPAGDGRWRFIIHDHDNSFWEPHRNNMNVFTTPGTGRGAGTPYVAHHRIPYYHDNQPVWAVAIWRNLLENATFRNTLAARYAAYTGTVFHPARFSHLVDVLAQEREADIGASFYRWHKHGGGISHSLHGWRHGLEQLRSFGQLRGRHGLEHMVGYFNRTDRPHLNLGLSGGFKNVRWQTDTTRGFFDIAGAQIRPDLFERDGAATFDLDNFNADFIWGLPIAVTARAFEGYRFSHFEVEGLLEKTVTENPMTLYVAQSHASAQSGTGGLVVRAVFERN
ncbi:MAG: CotH kinase family protein [Defluviitaleaceae bacterium]|nr:CotH kinase family protein [Defluviitaleaceae bacterium]MCL2238931.1 CotH kinase family protein [Defluviitaleaceae bacterium]